MFENHLGKVDDGPVHQKPLIGTLEMSSLLSKGYAGRGFLWLMGLCEKSKAGACHVLRSLLGG